MSSIILNFTHNPSVIPTYWQALTKKRKGVEKEEELPSIEGTIHSIEVDKTNLNLYRKLCLIEENHINSDSFLPVLYPHVIAGVLHLHIMTHPQFPLKLLGAIHKYNTFDIKRPIKIDEKFSIRAWIGSTRYLPSGVEFDLHTEVKVGSELVWSETSTYFKRQRFNVHQTHTPPFIEAIDATNEIASWKLDPWLGKKYATVSKDFNPIHLNKYLAKFFGFHKDLAHGMCTAAQALSHFPANSLYHKIIKIYFKGPSYIGSQMSLKNDEGNPSRFDLFSSKNQRPVIAFEILEK